MEPILTGLAQLADPATLGMIALGVFVGTIFGVLPGLTATMAIALLVPVTFGMPALLAIPFLVGIYRGGLYGGVITAILLGVPGTGANVATVIDGYELSKKGYPRVALQCSLFGSVTGAVFASILLMTLIGPIAAIALSIRSPDVFALLLFSMTLVTYLSGDKLAKGVLAAGAGVFLALIGLDPVVGTPRFTLGLVELRDGIPSIAMFIGLFAIPELAAMVEQRIGRAREAVDTGEVRPSFRAPDDDIRYRDVVRRYWRTILRSCGIGSFIGVMPGVGSETSPWLAYATAKRTSKRSENFGKGEPEGVVAAETANDAVVGAAFIPLLLFGIPGDLPLAIMLGALLAQGLNPTPRLFVEQPEIMYGIVASVLAASILLYVIVRPLTRLFSMIVYVPSWALVPIIVGLCIAGAFSVNNSVFDLVALAVFGVLGYLVWKTEFPRAPLVLGYVLGGRLEMSFRESLLLDPSPTVFVSSPLSTIFLVLAALVIISAVVRGRRVRAGHAGTPTRAD